MVLFEVLFHILNLFVIVSAVIGQYEAILSDQLKLVYSNNYYCKV